MARIALYGGSFNPPHQGHLDVLNWVINDCPIDLDEVWVLPTVNHALSKDLVEYEIREELVQAMIDEMLAIRPFGASSVKEVIKVVRREEVYTAELLDNLEAENPGTEFIPVIGADIINAAADWHRWGDVVARNPIVVARKGVECKTDLTVYEVDAAEVSSTSVRGRLASGDLTYLIGPGADLPFGVMRLIEEKHLYGWPEKEKVEGTATLDRVEIPFSELTRRFRPGQEFSLTGPIKQVVDVHTEILPVGVGKGVAPGVVFTVILSPTMEEYLLRFWHWKLTEARKKGVEPDMPKPQPTSPGIVYFRVGDEIPKDVGEYLGHARGHYFFKSDLPTPARSILGL